MLKLVAALTILTAPVPAFAAAGHPDWKALADCAAAYRANAMIQDPDRAASMKAMISEEADSYAKAAVRRRRASTSTSKPVAEAAVNAEVAARTADFTRQSRDAVDHFIDACPQADD